MSTQIITTLQEAKALAKKLKQNGKKIVATNGCFDILHVGHTRYLQASKTQGDVLIVGLNSDSSVRALKGETRPINSEQDRAELLLALKSVDHVVIFTETNACEFLKAIEPEIYTKGGDYSQEELYKWPEYPVAQELNTQISLIDFVQGKSSSAIIKQIVLSFVLLCSILLPSWATDALKVSVNNKEISINQTVQATVSVQGPMSQIDFPMNTEDYQVVGQASSSNISIINGVKSQSNKKTYTLKAKHTGVITIPALQIVLDGQVHNSNPIQVTVKESASQTEVPAKTAAGIFAKAKVSKANPFANQQILYTVKVYHTGNLKQIGGLHTFTDDNFLVERINEGKEYREQLGNTNYFVYEINFNLFPVSAGHHTIPPIDLDIVSVRRARNSAGMPMFLSPFAYEERHKISTNPISLNVKAFPPHSTKHFTGYIGELIFQHELEQKQIKEGEALSLNVNFYGDGNPNNISYQVVEESDQYDTFVDKPSQKSVYEDNMKVFGLSNRIAIVPQKSGKISIKIKPITVYNPKSNSYDTLKGHEYIVDVKPNPELKKLKAKQRESSSYKVEVPKALMAIPVEQIQNYQNFRLRALWMLVTFLCINAIGLILNFGKIRFGLPKFGQSSKGKFTKALKDLEGENSIVGISTKVKDLLKNLELEGEMNNKNTDLVRKIDEFIKKTDRLNYGLSPQANIDTASIKEEAKNIIKELKK